MKVKYSKMDIIIEVLCLVMLIGTVLYLIINWSSVPDKVPMHYNFAGKIDRWGNKSELIVLPIFSWLLFISMTVIEQFPQIWNTGVTVTEENRIYIYRILKNMLHTTKLITICIFTYMTINTITETKLSSWFTLIVLFMVFGNIIFWIIRLMNIKQKK